MNVRVKFLGGAESVTGSKFLLEIDDFKLLVDCGLFQGLKELRLRNWDPLPVDPNTIDAIIITHAHIDHSGYLPLLVKEGFSGPVYCTQATASLLDILLKDAAKLQEEEAEYARKKGYSKHNPPKALFTIDDAEAALALLNPYAYQKKTAVSEKIDVTFSDAGHILGSSIVSVDLKGTSQKKTLVFSGDLGRYDQPLLYDPTPIEAADVLFIESTYGASTNQTEGPEKLLAQIVNQTFDNNGCVLIPSFAVGRTQLLLYYFHYLLEHKLIPDCNIYLDSPMAINATFLHKKNRKDHKLSVGRNEHSSIFDDSHFRYYKSQESSVNLNTINSKTMIISASGMCTGGRILHHLFHRLPRVNDTLLFVGYQAVGSRGRKILEGEPNARIFGLDVPVKCNVEYIEGLSAHADQPELIRWASTLGQPPKFTFVVHGEPDVSKVFAKKLKTTLAWPNVMVPQYLESVELFRGI